VFIDRDGTLNEERDFLTAPDELRLVRGAGPAVKRLNEAGATVCVISNQSGIARGYLTEQDLSLIHERLVRLLASDGASLDGIYYCPHHPDEGRPPYRADCDCRKPKPGMLNRASRELGIDLSRSFVIGDKSDDILAGKAVHATTFLVMTGYGKQSLERFRTDPVQPDHVVPSLVEAVDYIVHTVR